MYISDEATNFGFRLLSTTQLPGMYLIQNQVITHDFVVVCNVHCEQLEVS